MGLNVDKPWQESGNSNDEWAMQLDDFLRTITLYYCSLEIIGVDEDLFRRFYVILQTLVYGFTVNPEKLGEYTCTTA